jgi:hypothetical protein
VSVDFNLRRHHARLDHGGGAISELKTLKNCPFIRYAASWTPSGQVKL